MYKPHLIIACLAFGLASCTGDTPASVGADLEPSFAQNGASGCYSVSGTISETGFPPNFAGTVSGDLEGTSATTIGFGGTNGKVIRNPGSRVIQVTGGSVPALVGESVEQSFEGISVNTGSGAIRINERTRVEGVAVGNLTTHGELVLGNPFTVELAYSGVICM